MSQVPSQQGLTVIKNWLSDVQCILFNEAEQTGIHFITVSVKTTKLFKSLTLKNSKLQFPRKLTFFFLTMQIGELLIQMQSLDIVMEPNSTTGQSFQSNGGAAGTR